MQSNLFSDRFQLPLSRADVVLQRQFLSVDEAADLYVTFQNSLAWQQPEICVAGRMHKIPRLQAWHGEPEAVYTYSQSTFAPAYWTDELSGLRRTVEGACRTSFNSVLVNFYRSGVDGMGFHSDNEPELGAQPTIASLSLGCARRFVFKPIDKEEKHSYNLDLEAGDLLIMAGDTQRYWRHGLPKTRRTIGGRINLTFRYIQPLPGF